MEPENNKIDELTEELFITRVLGYESELIEYFEISMNIAFKGFKRFFEKKEPANEDYIIDFAKKMQNMMPKHFPVIDKVKEIFQDFHYAIDESNEKIYYESSCILRIFSKYLSSEERLGFDKVDPVFDFLYYFYDSEEEKDRKIANKIIIDFILSLYHYIIYRDYLQLVRIVNSDFLVSPNDNHIPIRIALLDSLNLISDLNNNVPNKENIYRIIHAIVGGNEDNVKKYCLSLIGNNSLSQKQITRKHKEFAQKYINEKKL